MPGRASRRRNEVELPDGTAMSVRSVESGDRELLISMFDRLGERSRYRRFLSPKQRLTDRELARLTEVDHHDQEALVGLAGEGGEQMGVGVARFVRSEPDESSAEVAVAVTDDWQGRGVGAALLEQLADRARAEGVRRFTALILAENREVRGLFERVGDVGLEPMGEGQLHLDIELPDREGIGPGLARALKAAARRDISLGEAGNVFRRAPEEIRARLREIGAPPRVRRAGPIRTVLAGCDSSDGARRAADGAAAVAGAVGARVVVVGAYEETGDGARSALRRTVSPGGADRESVEKSLSVAAATVEEAGVEVSVDARAGDAASAILDAAHEQGADLIVVGDRRMREHSRHLLGSVADRVSHHAPCSVLIVRG